MDLFSYYLQFLTEICEGTRPLPEGMTLTAQDDMQKAMELQAQIQAMGIPAFVRACAAQSGTEIPEAAYESFDEGALMEALRHVPVQEETMKAAELPEEAPAEPVRTEVRDIYEVFLDSVCLEDELLQYLIDIVRRGAKDEFQKLSHAAARTLLDMDEFLLWLGNKEAFAGPDERACAAIMDGCLNRLMQEGQRELAAALLSGDETTFKLFRTQAPELVHLPDATYEWYAQNYLDRYYPVRFILRMNGVAFPELAQKEE